MILAAIDERTTSLFPTRKPEPSEAMTPEESAAFSAWQTSVQGTAFYTALAEHIVRGLDPGVRRLLSIGEGEGLLTSRLAPLIPWVEVVGVDVCPRVIERARAREGLPANLRFEVGSAYALGPLGSADAIVCASAFHHFEDGAAAARELVSALAPGGRLHLIDLRRDADLGGYFRWVEHYLRRDELVKVRLFRASVAASHTQDELRELFSPYGSPRVQSLQLKPPADPALRATWSEELLVNMKGLLLELTLQRAR